jgi:predicted HTH domain antitoxin
MKWDELGRIFQGKAAELAGKSRPQFLVALHRFRISPFQLTLEKLAKKSYHQGSEP